MHAYNPRTGEYERVCLDVEAFVARLKRKLRQSRTASEAFEAGGDFTDMAKAAQRGKNER